MAESFSVTCECGRDVAFSIADVPELDHYILEETGAAERYARREVEEEFAGFIDPEVLAEGDQDGYDLFELAAAIRRGDRAEAELQLDRLSEALGPKAVERVQIGRFSPRAKGAA